MSPRELAIFSTSSNAPREDEVLTPCYQSDSGDDGPDDELSTPRGRQTDPQPMSPAAVPADSLLYGSSLAMTRTAHGQGLRKVTTSVDSHSHDDNHQSQIHDYDHVDSYNDAAAAKRPTRNNSSSRSSTAWWSQPRGGSGLATAKTGGRV